MIIIRSISDIQKARLPTHLARYIEKLIIGITSPPMHIIPEDDGHIICITPSDKDVSLCEKIGLRWAESMFEGCSYVHDHSCYHAVFIRGNQFTVSVIVPSDQNIDPAIIARIVREAA